MRWDTKKLEESRKNRICLDNEVKFKMARQEKKFRKAIGISMRATWSKELE